MSRVGSNPEAPAVAREGGRIVMHLRWAFMAIDRRRTFLADVARVMAGTVGAQALTFALMPVVTRLYSASSFGVMTTFGTVVTTIGVVSCGCYEQAIVLPKRDDEGLNVALVGMLCCLVTVAGCFAAVLVGYEALGRWLFGVGSEMWLWLVPVAVFATGIHLLLTYWTTRRGRFGQLAASSFLEAVGNQGTKISFGWVFGDKVFGLIAGVIGYAILPAVALFAQLLRRDSHLLRCPPKRSDLAAVAHKFRNFPLYATWNELLVNLCRAMPVFFLGGMYGIAVVGTFGLANNTLRLPVTVISNSFRSVFLQRLTASTSKKRGLPVIMLKSTLSLLLIALVPFGVLAIAGPMLFALVFGHQWSEAGVYAQVLTPWLVSIFILPPTTIVYTIAQKQHVRLRFYLAMVVAQLCCFWVGNLLKMDGTALLCMVSVVCAGINLIKILVAYRISVTLSRAD